MQLLLLESQGLGGLIADFCRTPILDGTRIDVSRFLCPLVANGSKCLEGFAVEFDQGLADNGLHLTITALHVHHHGDRNTTGYPLLCRSCGILHDGHIASLAVGDELGGTGSKGVAIVGIEVGRSGTTSFVAEEVVLGCKLAIVLVFLLPLCQFSLAHLREKFFGLDERHLYVAVRVTVERELPSHTFRQRLEGGGILLGQVSDDVFALCLFVQVFIVGTMSGEQVVQFLNQSADGWNKLDKAFGDNDRTEVVACSSTGCDDLAKLLYHLVQREVFLLDFLRDQTDVGLRLKGTFQCDMGSRTSHHLNEMPVFACRITVALNVSNQLGIGFASGVEAEGRLNLVVLQVAVDGLRTANHLYAILLGCIVFCQDTSIGIGVVAANDDNGFDV